MRKFPHARDGLADVREQPERGTAQKGGIVWPSPGQVILILEPKCSPADFGNGNPLRTMDVKELRMPGRIFRRYCHGMAGLCF